MTEEHFVRIRGPFWAEMETLTRGGARNLRPLAADFPARCRRLSADLNTARSCGMDSQLIDRLNRLTIDAWRLLQVPRPASMKSLARFVLRTVPRSVRAQWRSFLVANLLFWGIGFLAGFAVVRWPALATELASESQLADVEEMYDPDSEYYLKPRAVTSDADMFGFYIYNNISIAFKTFGGGVLAGVGSLLILVQNALFLGIVTGHLVSMGYTHTFFSFVIAHGSFELTAIVMAAQAGLLTGWSLFARRGLSVRSSLKRAARRAFPIIGGAGLMLVVAAFIEAFWSSRHELPLSLRYSAGAALWVLVALWLSLSGRVRRP